MQDWLFGIGTCGPISISVSEYWLNHDTDTLKFIIPVLLFLMSDVFNVFLMSAIRNGFDVDEKKKKLVIK